MWWCRSQLDQSESRYLARFSLEPCYSKFSHFSSFDPLTRLLFQEAQAFDRVHRLGQSKEVFVNRLVIENSVEDRLISLQATKGNLAAGSLDGEVMGKTKKLTVRGKSPTLVALPCRADSLVHTTQIWLACLVWMQTVDLMQRTLILSRVTSRRILADSGFPLYLLDCNIPKRWSLIVHCF